MPKRTQWELNFFSKIYIKNDSQKKVVKDISDDNFIKFQWAWIL